MERGQLGKVEASPAVVFVFEGLIGKLAQRRLEKVSLRMRRWESALDCWGFDYQVCDYINACITRFNTPIEVITSRAPGFAELVHDRLWDMECPVDRTRSGSYRIMSQRFATDPKVGIVYDPDPKHRYGYGYKAREFNLGQF